MRRIPLFTFVLAALLHFQGCSKKENSGGAREAPPAALVAEVSSVTARTGRAPNFSWKDRDGRVMDFDAFRGRVTLVNFWATWCVPCKRELPDLVALSKEFVSTDIRILGVSTDRGANVVQEVGSFIQEHGIPYQNVVSNEELEDAFGNIRMIPTSFLIDRDGRIAQTYVGPRSKDFFKQAIEALRN